MNCKILLSALLLLGLLSACAREDSAPQEDATAPLSLRLADDADFQKFVELRGLRRADLARVAAEDLSEEERERLAELGAQLTDQGAGAELSDADLDLVQRIRDAYPSEAGLYLQVALDREPKGAVSSQEFSEAIHQVRTASGLQASVEICCHEYCLGQAEQAYFHAFLAFAPEAGWEVAAAIASVIESNTYDSCMDPCIC